MSFYRNTVYPVLVDRLGNPEPIRRLRREIVPLARGTVLEIGLGSGANCPYYDASNVRRLYALERNAGMRRRAGERLRRTGLDVEFLSLRGDRIPLGDASVDTVVSTFTLCTIAAVEEALSGLARVLRSEGALLFLENSAAEDMRVRAWQRWWEPIHHRVFDGLFLTRDIPFLVAKAGFRMERVHCVYLSRFPKSWAHCCWGVATKR
jgi:ubiquinone/menaquinone biosynthesis C-methylase UbiE